jgi:hypothetical protein
MSSAVRRGSIIYATFLDPQGRNAKRRPALVLTPPENIGEDMTLEVVMVSGEYQGLPEEQIVLLPWHAQGHCTSRLTKECAAICSWVGRVSMADLTSKDVGGYIGGAKLIEVLQKVDALRKGGTGPK